MKVLAAVVLVLGACSAWADEESPARGKPAVGLVNLGLEDLMTIEVTSVSKRLERLSDAAASIYVITGEEIRRAGVTSLPEALRLAPNLEVAQVSASGYAITARGFNNTSANKLLVLIDGRSVYTPLFSGVFWDAQDVMLEDVERIEVISGPGGTLWGVNAVNGVINVITRAARDTPDGLLSAGAGNRGSDIALRYGGPLGAYGNYRVFGKYFDRLHTVTADGTPKADAWHQGHVGGRADWQFTTDRISVLGNVYKGTDGQPLPGAIVITGVRIPLAAIPIQGSNVLGTWSHVLGNGSTTSLQAYYDRTDRTVTPTFAEKLSIIGLQFQHSIRAMGMHSLTWGSEYRRSMDRVVNGTFFGFLPAHVDQEWWSLFAQDEVRLRANVRVTLGARLEHNDYTGAELLPNVRVAWKPRPDQLWWAAASRTVRAPSRLDHDAFVPSAPPFLLAGGATVVSETANVYEAGYRGQHSTSVQYSVTLFHADYDDLRTQEIAPSRTFLFFANGMKGRSDGVELWATVQPVRMWRLSGGFTDLRERLHLKAGSNDVNAPRGQMGRDPARSWRVRLSADLPGHGELDIMARRVSELSIPPVPAYTAVDVRYGWRPSRRLELSAVAQNLVGAHHGEFTASSTRTEFRRAVYLNVVSRFGQHD